MRSAYPLSPTQSSSPLRRRATAVALTLAAHALLLFLLLTIAPPNSSGPADDLGLKTFNVAPEATPAAPTRAVPKSRPAGEPRPTPPVTPPPPTVPPPPLFIPGLENFDLRQVRSSVARTDPADGPEGLASQDQQGAATYGPSEAPGGGRLYNAEWHREPTRAELALYLPEGRRIGWGMIACQTIEKYHVDNCRELGSEPPGSGLSRAIRQAAWQFLVRPPRIDGRPMIGAWVRIRVEFTEEGAVIAPARRR